MRPPEGMPENLYRMYQLTLCQAMPSILFIRILMKQGEAWCLYKTEKPNWISTNILLESGNMALWFILLNSDLYPTEIVDIKKFADSIKSGVSCFLTNSNTIKLSGMGSVFTIGLALKRSVDSAAVIMFAYSEKKLYFLFKNNTWDDSVRVLSL